MTIIDIVRDLRRKGIEWRVDGGKLMFRPANAPQDVKDCILRHKPALAAYALPGWPADVQRPEWWLALAGGFPIGTFTRARPQVCGDPSCGFRVSVEWMASDDGRLRWSCPKCGLQSADPDELPNIAAHDWAFECWDS